MPFRKQYYCKRTRHRLSLCVFVFVAIVSCTQKHETIHPDLRSIVKTIVDSINCNFAAPDNDIMVLNKKYAGINRPSLTDKSWQLYCNAAYYWYSKHDLQAGQLYADSCANLLKNHFTSDSLALLYAKICFFRSHLFYLKADFDEASRCVIMGKMALPENGTDNNTLIQYYENMSNVLFEEKRFTQAIKFYRLKCELAPKTTMSYDYVLGWVHGNLNNIALCYRIMKMPDSAMYYFDSTLRYLNTDTQNLSPLGKAILPKAIAVVNSTKADLLLEQKDTVSAEKLYLQSTTVVSVIPDTNFQAFNRLALIKLYLERKQTARAYSQMQKLSIDFDTVFLLNRFPVYYVSLLYDYYVYYSRTNQEKKANDMLVRAFSIKDSIAARQALFRATDASHIVENQERNETIKKQQQDNQLKTNFLLIATIGALLAIIMVMTVYNLKKKSQYADRLTAVHEQLTQQNLELEKTLLSLHQSNKENDKLVRVVAHDLKSPISAMRTLVYVLKKDPLQPDKEILDLIENTCADAIVRIKELLENKRA